MGLSIHFECRDDYGAVLLLHPLGVSHAIKSHNLISRYMRQHFERWLEFANSRFELGLKDEELIFVCGTIKTSRWGVAAFHGDYREKSGSITGNMSSLASVDFSLRVADAQLQSAYYRAGPPRYRLGPAMPMAISEGEVAGAGTAGDQDKADQCIFVHYYKMKRRMFVLQFPIRAAASPRDLSEDHEDDVPGSTSWCDAIVVDESGDLGEGEHRQESISRILLQSMPLTTSIGLRSCNPTFGLYTAGMCVLYQLIAINLSSNDVQSLCRSIRNRSTLSHRAWISKDSLGYRVIQPFHVRGY